MYMSFFFKLLLHVLIIYCFKKVTQCMYVRKSDSYSSAVGANCMLYP